MHFRWRLSCFDEPLIFFVETVISLGKVTKFAEIGGCSEYINAKRLQSMMFLFPFEIVDPGVDAFDWTHGKRGRGT